jgi:hypothetical protein
MTLGKMSTRNGRSVREADLTTWNPLGHTCYGTPLPLPLPYIKVITRIIIVIIITVGV